MARINGSVSQRSDSYSFYIEWSESNIDTSSNASKVSATAYIYCSNHTAYGSSYPQKLVIDGTEFTNTLSINLSPGVTVALVSGSKTITHNSDGKKSVTISASCDLPDGGGWGPAWGSASGTATLTTIPRTSNVSLSSTNFNIGSSITINTNRASSSFTHTAVIKFNGSTVRTQTGIGASYSWSTSELYQYVPKANSATGTVTLTTYSGSTEIGSSSVSFTANVTNSNPTFSNCTYEDTGSVSTQLTGNNQILINNYNVLKVTISTANKAVAKNSATMVKYRLVCGSKSVEASYSSTANVTLSLSYVTSMTFIVYAIDSRGNSTAVTKSVAEWKNYSDIVIKTGSAVRTDGVGKETTLTFEGTLWKTEEQLDFGAVANEITLCQYKYKKSNESEYGEPIDIVPNVSEGKFSFSSVIQGDAGAEGFNLSNSFNIQITVKDKIKTAIYDILLGSGTPAIAIHRNGVAFGGLYDEDKGGALQIEGIKITPKIEVVSNTEIATNEYINGKRVYIKQLEFTDTLIGGNSFTKAHGITGASRIWIDTANSYMISTVGKTVPLPCTCYDGNFSDRASLIINGDNIILWNDTGWGESWTKVIRLKYVK